MTKNHQEKTKTQKMTDKNISPTQQTGLSEDEVASAAVLRVVGEDIDSTYPDVDDHPGSLDLPVQRRREKATGPTSSPRR